MIALHTVASALETWQTNYGRICCELYAPPKCRAFIAICCNMRTTHTTGLPYGMSNVTNPDFLRTAELLYSLYPGIHKLRIKRRGRSKMSVTIRVISGTSLQRTKVCKGYSLASALGNLLQCIKRDRDLHDRLAHPERCPPDKPGQSRS